MIGVRGAARASVVAALCVALASVATAAVNIETVPVGNKGNTGELSGSGAGGNGPDRICGAVDYNYRIGKFEVTAGQYTEFLSAVARTDAYGLYNTNMWSSNYGCKIQRNDFSGSFTYSVAADWANRPVNYVSWGDAARFCNWLANGQPTTGVQNLTTTEDGSYYLNGAISHYYLLPVVRKDNARYVIPSEDEWYKAAYYDPNKPGGPGYWKYPMGSNSVPSNELANPDPGNNANFAPGGQYTIGSPYYRTEVGEFENSESPYGTFDQNGNVFEWNEELVYTSARGLRGGSFGSDGTYGASVRVHVADSAVEADGIGFRVVEVPEPATLALLALSGLGMLVRRRRK